MTVTAEELAQRCDWVTRRNLRLIKEQGFQNADFYFGRGPGSLLYNLRLDLIADLMNSGLFQEYLFALVRLLIEDAGYDCCVFASDTWALEHSELFYQLPAARAAELLRTRSIAELAELGYGKRIEAISVVAETPDLVWITQTPYYRDVLQPDRVAHVGEIRSGGGDLNTLSGRVKFFGRITDREAQRMRRKVGKLASDFRKRGVDLPGATALINIATEAP